MIKRVKYAKYYIDNTLDGKIIKINNGFTDITGYSWDDVKETNLSLFDLIPQIYQREYKSLVLEAYDNGEAYLNHDIVCKDGSVIAVNCFGETYIDKDNGHECSKILIVDVTEQINAVDELREKQEQLELQIEKIKFLTENAQEIFVDYDIQKDYFEISRFNNGEYEIFHSKENYLNSANETIHEDDFQTFCEALLVAKDDGKKAVLDFRSKLFSMEYRWFRFIYAKYINPKTGKSHIIGRIEDIHDEKMASLNIEDDSQMDILTGIFNKRNTELKINEILENDMVNHNHTMLLIDVDHLRKINDEYGYHVGDIILEKISLVLCSMFRQNFDIIGRVSGDAFVVFIRNTREVSYIEKKCIEICTVLQREFRQLNKKTNFMISVSIGIALGDEKTDLYKKLYKKAGKALQNQRKRGRNGYSF